MNKRNCQHLIGQNWQIVQRFVGQQVLPPHSELRVYQIDDNLDKLDHKRNRLNIVLRDGVVVKAEYG